MMVVMKTSLRRYRYRAYPGRAEQNALSRTFGCCRVIKNDAIDVRQSAWKAGGPYPTLGELSKRLITDAKKTPERAWLGHVSAVALQQALFDVDRAYRNFFASRKGKRNGRKLGPPKRASRHDRRQSARFTKNSCFRVEATGDREAVVTLPRVGRIPFVLSRALPSEPSSVSVIREADGRTYVSFVVEVETRNASPTARACGIDVGLSSFATLYTRGPEGTKHSKIETPSYLRRRERALARSQKALSRKKAWSNNCDRARRRVAIQHRKVREARLDHAHQRAAEIVGAHDVVCVEDISVRSMAKGRLAKAVHDQALSQFLRVLCEKAAHEGRLVVKVGRRHASTQICSGCGAVTGPKGQAQLGVRHWTCPTCNSSHDRDENAAANILAEGLRLLGLAQPDFVAAGRAETENACGAGVSGPKTGPVGVEAGRTAVPATYLGQ
jgi:putative transposase